MGSFPKLFNKLYGIRFYSTTTKLGLQFLPEALLLSSKSDALIGFARAEKPFSQRALGYPTLVKESKAALAAYLERVERADDEADPLR